MKKVILPLVLFLFVFSSCKKDEKCETTSEKIAGTYKVTAGKYKQTSSSAEVDLLLLLDVCERDDLEILNANGGYEHRDAGTTCTPNGTFTGTWTLNGNTITIDGEVGNITSFDCSTLVFTVSGYLISGDVATFTLTKQ